MWLGHTYVDDADVRMLMMPTYVCLASIDTYVLSEEIRMCRVQRYVCIDHPSPSFLIVCIYYYQFNSKASLFALRFVEPWKQSR